MRSHTPHFPGVLVGFLTCLVPTAATCAQESSGETVPIAELAAACREAATKFRPLTDADLDRARGQVVAAAGRLDERLRLDGDNGLAWRRYLLWDRLEEFMRAEQPDLATADAVFKRHSSGQEGLALVWFADVREALQHYRALALAKDNEKLPSAYEQLMNGLADRLEAYVAEPTPEQADVISAALAQLEDLRQAPEVRQAIRRRLARPNVYVQMAQQMITARMDRPIDDTSPVDERILGTDFHGTGHTLGDARGELVPDEQNGVVDLVFSGVMRSRNTGYQFPVRISNRALSNIGSRKRIWINAAGAFMHPTQSRAKVSTRILGIRAKFGNPLVEKIAWKQACLQKREAERISARRTERRINERFDKEAAELVEEFNEVYNKRFRKPLMKRRLFPDVFRFSSTARALKLFAVQAHREQLAAPVGPPPLAAEDPAVALRIHESAINNAASTLLAGMTVSDEMLRRNMAQLLGRLPGQSQDDQQDENHRQAEPSGQDGQREDQSRTAIAFARRQPVTVLFADGGFRMTIRGRRYYRGEESFPAMDVTASYRFQEGPQEFQAIRQGEIEVFPPGFVPGSGQKLTTRQVVIRRQLRERFAEALPEELPIKPLEIPGNWSRLGKLRTVEINSGNGWLTVVWEPAPTGEAATEAPD